MRKKLPGRRRKLLALLVGLLFSAVFVALSLRRIDLQGLWHTLLISHWWPWYLLAPIVYVIGLWVRGIRCQVILRPHCDISTLTATNVVVIGYAANNVLPARMGEVVRAYVLGRRAGVSVSLSLAVTFLERLFDGLAITLLLVVAASFATLPEWSREILWLAVLVFLSGATAVVLITAARPFVTKLSRGAAGLLPERFASRLVSILERAFGATDCLKNPAVALSVVLLSVAVWVIEGAMYLVILPAFDLPLAPVWAGMAVSVTNLGILVPSSPGYVGPFHYFCMRTLLIFGVPAETALGYAMVVHALSYIPVTTWGLFALAAYGVRLSTAVEADAPGRNVVVAPARPSDEIGPAR